MPNRLVSSQLGVAQLVSTHVAFTVPNHESDTYLTGIVLASRLSFALPNTSVLLIETGVDGDPRLEPTQGYRAGLDTNLEWDHSTFPQKGLGGKRVKQVQGKVLGGSSAINIQGWTRGPGAYLQVSSSIEINSY
jgi:choline dehydrogenase-like flavoprotein